VRYGAARYGTVWFGFGMARALPLMAERERVTVVGRGLLVEVLVVATFILVVLMMFGVSFA
jgi:hypothetical protein